MSNSNMADPQRIPQEVRPEYKNFVVFDFETANPKRDSACAIGVVKVVDYHITNALYSLIDPETNEWGSFQISIHKILPSHVQGKPKFNEIWTRVESLLADAKFFVGHGDIEKQVIKACCDRYGLTIPSIPYHNTANLAKKKYGMTCAKLNVVCERFGIELNHHNALSDAVASARIILQYVKDKECGNVGRGSCAGTYPLSDAELLVIDNAMK